MTSLIWSSRSIAANAVYRAISDSGCPAKEPGWWCQGHLDRFEHCGRSNRGQCEGSSVHASEALRERRLSAPHVHLTTSLSPSGWSRLAVTGLIRKPMTSPHLPHTRSSFSSPLNVGSIRGMNRASRRVTPAATSRAVRIGAEPLPTDDLDFSAASAIVLICASQRASSASHRRRQAARSTLSAAASREVFIIRIQPGAGWVGHDWDRSPTPTRNTGRSRS